MPLSTPIQADRELDCKGLLCPMPILQTRKAIETMQIGEILKMVSTDLASVVDVQAWARRTGQELMHYEDEGAIFTFYIRKVK